MTRDYWRGKSVAVCGASAGLGRQFAWELAAQHVAKLAIIARSTGQLQELREELRLRHPELQVVPISADLCQRHSAEAAARQVTAEFGSIDLLIQAVGQSDRGKILDLTQATVRDLIDANLMSSLFVLQCFAPLITRPGGDVIFIGSLACKFAPRFLGGYAIAKHALAGLAQQARLELADDGIHVLLACPGPIAREDAGDRYQEFSTAGDLPSSSLKPGGGAQLQGLDPRLLVQAILKAAERKRAEIIRPRRARLLHLISAVFPGWGDSLLRKNSS